MKASLKTKWVAALRSGKFEQANGVLRNSTNGYCCLGVLCEVNTGRKPKIGKHYYGSVLLGKELMEKLSKMNDGEPPYKKNSFARIATYIEKHI